MDVYFDVPDVGADDRTGLSVWPVLVNGVEVGRVVERVEGYQARTESGGEVIYGKERSFREQAIEDIKRLYLTEKS